MKCRWVAEDFECPRVPIDTDFCFVFCKYHREDIKKQRTKTIICAEEEKK